MYSYSLIDLILSDETQAGSNACKQRKILEAAVELFAEKGFANTTTSEIAKAAGIAEGTLFRYYKTKEVLLMALFNPFHDVVIPHVSQEVLKLLKDRMFRSLEDMLTFFLRDRLEFIRVNQKIFKVYVKELFYREEFRKSCILQIKHKEIMEYAEGFIREAKQNREISDLPDVLLLRTFGMMAISYFVARFTILPQELFLDDETEIKLLVRQIMNSIRV